MALALHVLAAICVVISDLGCGAQQLRHVPGLRHGHRQHEPLKLQLVNSVAALALPEIAQNKRFHDGLHNITPSKDADEPMAQSPDTKEAQSPSRQVTAKRLKRTDAGTVERHAERSDSGRGRLVYAIFVSCVVLYVFYKFCLLWKSYRTSAYGFKRKGFKEYAWYQFENWFVTQKYANAYIIVGASVFTLVIGTALHAAIMRTNMYISLWRVFTWIVDPGVAVSVPEYKAQALCLGGVIGVTGLVLFGLLLTLMQDSFADFLEMLKLGRSPIMEMGHVMIIGFTAETNKLIQELCHAYDILGGTAIVVFSDRHSKEEIEQGVKEGNLDQRGSRIIARTGKPYHEEDLRHSAAHMARTIILLPERSDTKEMRDAFILRILVALRSSGYPENGRILAVCSLFRNMELFKSIGGNSLDVVMLDRFLPKVMVQCSRQADLSTIFSQVFGYSSGEILYISKVPPELNGKTFTEASRYYSHALPVAVFDEHSDFVDFGSRTLHTDQDVVLLIEDADDKSAGLRPEPAAETFIEDLVDPELAFMTPKSSRPAEISQRERALAEPSASTREVIRSPRMKSLSEPTEPDQMDSGALAGEIALILGWNESIGMLILELDDHLPADSEVIIVASVKEKMRNEWLHRTQRRWNQQISLKFRHVIGSTGSANVLEDLPVKLEQLSKIFILVGETNGIDYENASAMITTLQVREKLLRQGIHKKIAIVPEVRGHRCFEQYEHLQIPNVLDTAGLPAKVLSMIAFQPKMWKFLEEITSKDGNARFSIRELKDYLPQECYTRLTRINFFQVCEIVARRGDTAIGWTKPFSATHEADYASDVTRRGEFHKQMQMSYSYTVGSPRETGQGVREFQMNPHSKDEFRDWSFVYDRIAVLTGWQNAMESPSMPLRPLGVTQHMLSM